MNASDFKNKLNSSKREDIEVYDINIISADFNSRYDISNHVAQKTRHNIIESFYTDKGSFDKKNHLSAEAEMLIPKMLNWKAVQADFYIWINPEYKLSNPQSIEWLVKHLKGLGADYGFFNDVIPSVNDEVLRIKSQGVESEYDINEINKYIARASRDVEFIHEVQLLDPAIFIYSKEAVRFDLNFFETWFLHTISGGMNEKLSLAHTVALHQPALCSFEHKFISQTDFFTKR